MTTVAEIAAVCTEFQQNFASLSVRYTALQQELTTEREARAKQQQTLDDATQANDRQRNEIMELRQELDVAVGYKDKFLAASMAVEHLKGRLDTARRDVADSLGEHQEEAEQLRGQIRDLLKRIDSSSDGHLVTQLRSQSRELEERAAVVSGQLLEERERHSQQLLTAHSALREMQNRALEQEQRSRALESELQQMRSAVRRSMDLQNESAAQREKSLRDAAQAQQEVSLLKQSLEEQEQRYQTLHRRHEEELVVLQRTAAEERASLTNRVANLQLERDDAIAGRELMEQELSSLKRSVQRQLLQAKEDVAAEYDGYARARQEERVALQKAQAAAVQQELTISELKRKLTSVEERCRRFEAEHTEMQTLTTKQVQQAAWTAAERDQLQAQVGLLTRQVEEAQTLRQQHDALQMDAERLRLQLEYSKAEAADAKREVQDALTHVRAVEESCDKRLVVIHRQLKAEKKQRQADVSQHEAYRRKMAHALLAKDFASRPPTSASPSAVTGGRERMTTMFPSSSALRPLDTNMMGVGGGIGSGISPLEALKPLAAQAESLEAKLSSLSKHSRTSPTTSSSSPMAAAAATRNSPVTSTTTHGSSPTTGLAGTSSASPNYPAGLIHQPSSVTAADLVSPLTEAAMSPNPHYHQAYNNNNNNNNGAMPNAMMPL